MTTAYLFPGQGSQSVGMGRELYAQYPAARAVFDQADAFLGFPLSQLCFEGSAEALADTTLQQPALYTVGMARWAVVTAGGWPRPAYLAGHSLGEITALAAAGSLSLLAGLQLVQARGQLMAAAGARQAGGMAAIIGLDAARVSALCAEASAHSGELVTLANDNSPVQQVIAGSVAALDAALALAQAAGAAKIQRLPISIASHCALMADAADGLRAVLDTLPVNNPRIPVVSSVTAEALPAPRRIRETLAGQLTAPVRWTDTMRYLIARGVDEAIEVGPGDVLTRLLKRIDPTLRRATFDARAGTAAA